MAEFFSTSTEQTEIIGAQLGKTLKSGDLVALYGEMSAGKTVFIRGLAAGMGLNAFVSSPTFALVHEYKGDLPLFHFDMYRINSMEDLYSTGFFDYLDRNGVIAVEWSENIEYVLPENAITVQIIRSEINPEWRVIILEGRKIENFRD